MVVCLVAGGMAASAQPVLLLHPTNTTTWRYLSPLTDPGFLTDWKDANFIDTSWSTGRGLFGQETTAYPFPINTAIPARASSGAQDSFFRVHFNWSGSTQGVILSFTNYIDDGMVVFLNGTEIYRFNITGSPGSPVQWSGTPQAPAANPGGEPVINIASVDPTAPAGGVPATLNTGDNVIAVYVGQAGANSSDIVFGMDLRGSQSSAPVFTFPPPAGTNITITQCKDLLLAPQVSGLPRPTFQWTKNNVDILDATNMSFTVSNAQPPTASYRLRAMSSAGTNTSGPFTVTVTTDSAGPVLVAAVVNQARTKVTISFNEPVLPGPNQAEDTFKYRIRQVDDLGELGVCSGPCGVDGGVPVIVNRTNVVLSINPAEGAWQEGVPYRVDADSIPDACNGTPETSSIGIRVPPTIIDTKLQSTEADLRHDAQNPLVIDSDPQVEQTLLQFQNIFGTGPGQIPPGTNIISAQLRLNQTDPSGNQPRVHRMIAAWDGTATWNSFVEGVTNDGVEAMVAEDFIIAPGAANGIRLFDVTAAVQAWADDPSINHGWVILPGGADGLRFTSSEDANSDLQPALIITTGPLANVVITTNPPATLTTNEGATFSLTVSATGAKAYQWQRANHGSSSFTDIAGATASTLTITNANPLLHTGDYRVIVSNNRPSQQISTITYVQIIADTTAPTITAAVADGDLVTIRVTYSEPMGPSAGVFGNYTLTGATVTGATLSADGRTVLVTTTARTYGATHTLTIQNVFDRAATANRISPNPTVIQLRSDISCFVRWDATWRWVQDDPLLDGSGWQTPGFNDAGWTESAGLFGLEPNSNTVLAAIAPYTIQTPWTIGTATAPQPTYYLRKQITVPAVPAGSAVVMRHLIDDGAIVYTNGTEAFRYGTNTGVSVFYTNFFQQPTGGDANLLSQRLTLSPGSHLIAVEVHQTSATSSDVLFGAEFCLVQAARLSITRNSATGQTTVSWSPNVGTLEESTNVLGPWTTSTRLNGVAAATPGTAMFYRVRL